MKARFLTAERMLEIESSSIIDGDVDADGNLILLTRGGVAINAGLVRGPRGFPGADAAPGSVGPTPNTTPIRTSDGRVKVAPGTEIDDATAKKYVDDLTAPLASRTYVDTAVQPLSTKTYVDGAVAGAKVSGTWVRVGTDIRTTDTSDSASAFNVNTFTLPSPVNGTIYRVRAVGNYVPNTAGMSCAIQLKHAIGAGTGGTQIHEIQMDFRAAGRVVGSVVEGEFVYTGTTGASGYNVVVVCVPSGGSARTYSGTSTRPMLLFVDRAL